MASSIREPPKSKSPSVESISNTPSATSTIEISKVQPPKSYTAYLFSDLASIFKIAAVGSAITLSTTSPAISPANLVACLSSELK